MGGSFFCSLDLVEAQSTAHCSLQLVFGVWLYKYFFIGHTMFYIG